MPSVSCTAHIILTTTLCLSPFIVGETESGEVNLHRITFRSGRSKSFRKDFLRKICLSEKTTKNPSHPFDIILVIYFAFYFDYKTSTQDNVRTVLMLQGFRKW